VHPLKHLGYYPLWISEATNYKNNPLGLRGAEKIIEEALPRSGLLLLFLKNNKPHWPDCYLIHSLIIPPLI
jgi:hypothetical protein